MTMLLIPTTPKNAATLAGLAAAMEELYPQRLTVYDALLLRSNDDNLLTRLAELLPVTSGLIPEPHTAQAAPAPAPEPPAEIIPTSEQVPEPEPEPQPTCPEMHRFTSAPTRAPTSGMKIITPDRLSTCRASLAGSTWR